MLKSFDEAWRIPCASLGMDQRFLVFLMPVWGEVLFTSVLIRLNMSPSFGSGPAKVILVISGFVFLALAVSFPVWVDSLREHGGSEVSAVFIPGLESIKEALGSVTTAVSIVSSIGVASIGLLFERSRSRPMSMLLGVVTLLIYSLEIMFALYLSVLRPLTGTVPSLFQVGLLLGFIPLGLGFTMFTLASVLHE